MVTIDFCKANEILTGFNIYGHSGYAEAGSDIVCASVSSCAIMVANTVTEILKLPAAVEAADGALSLQLNAKDAPKAQPILNGFLLHAKELSAEYPAYIQCNTKSTQ